MHSLYYRSKYKLLLKIVDRLTTFFQLVICFSILTQNFARCAAYFKQIIRFSVINFIKVFITSNFTKNSLRYTDRLLMSLFALLIKINKPSDSFVNFSPIVYLYYLGNFET